MEYEGICDKYGRDASIMLALATPAVLTSLGSSFTSSVSSAQGLITGLVTMFSAIAGFGLAARAHRSKNIALTKQSVDYEAGSKIVKRAQIIAYAKPFTAGLLLNAAILTMDFNKEAPQNFGEPEAIPRSEASLILSDHRAEARLGDHLAIDNSFTAELPYSPA